MSVFLLVRYPDRGRLRAVIVYGEEEYDQADHDRAFWNRAGYETIIVLGFDLPDVMRSHPSWFKPVSPDPKPRPVGEGR